MEDAAARGQRRHYSAASVLTEPQCGLWERQFHLASRDSVSLGRFFAGCKLSPDFLFHFSNHVEELLFSH
jgi:hypothetical protein